MSDAITYDRGELRSILRSFKSMDDEAIQQARKVSGDLASKMGQAIATKSQSIGLGAARVGVGYKVSKSSKIGELSFGYKSQKFSGGGDTQLLWPAFEFGSNNLPQFAPWSGRNPNGGRGSAGKFIYPTLRELQPYLIKEWETAFSSIVKEWDK